MYTHTGYTDTMDVSPKKLYGSVIHTYGTAWITGILVWTAAGPLRLIPVINHHKTIPKISRNDWYKPSKWYVDYWVYHMILYQSGDFKHHQYILGGKVQQRNHVFCSMKLCISKLMGVAVQSPLGLALAMLSMCFIKNNG